MQELTSNRYEIIYPSTQGSITYVSDTVCELLGLPIGSSVDEALVQSMAGKGYYIYKIKALDPYGNPYARIKVSGLTALNDTFSSLTTNSSGIFMGKSNAESVSLTLSTPQTYYDLTSTISQTISPVRLITTVEQSFTFKSLPEFNYFTSNTTFYCSPFIASIKATAVGGGAARAYSSPRQTPEGGEVKNGELSYNAEKIIVTIGAGGQHGGSGSGSDGSATTIQVGTTTLTGAGGSIYTSSPRTKGSAGIDGKLYGGSGGLGTYYLKSGTGTVRADQDPTNGYSPYGGRGAGISKWGSSSFTRTAGENGKGYGGAGGAGGKYQDDYDNLNGVVSAGNGYQGVAILQFIKK